MHVDPNKAKIISEFLGTIRSKATPDVLSALVHIHRRADKTGFALVSALESFSRHLTSLDMVKQYVSGLKHLSVAELLHINRCLEDSVPLRVPDSTSDANFARDFDS